MKTTDNKPITIEESYVQRRELFKHVWEEAAEINQKEDILKKPKVIKTLRMDEIDKYCIGKSKTDRIKNLRQVCHRILDFCDHHEKGYKTKRKRRTRLSVKRNLKTSTNKNSQKIHNIFMLKQYKAPGVINLPKLKSSTQENKAISSTSNAPPQQIKRKYETKENFPLQSTNRSENNNKYKFSDFPKEGTSTKHTINKKKRTVRPRNKSVIKKTSPKTSK